MGFHMPETTANRWRGATGPVRLVVIGSTFVVLSVIWLALGTLDWLPSPDPPAILGSITGGLLVIAAGAALAMRRRRDGDLQEP